MANNGLNGGELHGQEIGTKWYIHSWLEPFSLGKFAVHWSNPRDCGAFWHISFLTNFALYMQRNGYQRLRQQEPYVLNRTCLQNVSYDCRVAEVGVINQVGKVRCLVVKIALREGILSFSCKLFHSLSNLLSCTKSSTSGITWWLYPVGKCTSCLLYFALLILYCVILVSPTQQIHTNMLLFVTKCHFTNSYVTL